MFDKTSLGTELLICVLRHPAVVIGASTTGSGNAMDGHGEERDDVGRAGDDGVNRALPASVAAVCLCLALSREKARDAPAGRPQRAAPRCDRRPN